MCTERCRLVIVTAAALWVTACAGEAPTSPPLHVVVSGIVQNVAVPGPGIEVALMQAGDLYTEGHLVLDVDTTDASGRFLLDVTWEDCPNAPGNGGSVMWAVAFVGSTGGYHTRRSEALEPCSTDFWVIVDIDDAWPGPNPPF